MKRTTISTFVIALLLICRLPITPVLAAPAISNINLVTTCNTSVSVNFRVDSAAHAFLEYGLTTSYGSTTIDDPVRTYREHLIQITGLTSGTTYHYRINVTNSTGTTQSSDQTFTTTSGNTTCINMPTEIDSRMPNMTGAVEKTVKASGGDYTPLQLQTALNDAGVATTKRIITIDAGLVLTAPAGAPFTAPANADQNQIIVRSSAHASLPEGKKVFPADAPKMPLLRNVGLEPALQFAAGSNHIRFIGIEITIDPSVFSNAPGGQNQTGLVQMQANVTNQASLPKFITFDRCYVHGHPTKNTGRGIFVMGEDIAIIDSYVFDFHFSGFDGQAILGADVRRWRILNNTIVASSESFMWGGTGLRIDGYSIGELEYLRNHMYNPCKWKPDGGCGAVYEGVDWPEKNLFECKTCAQVIMFGNFFGGVTTSQGGFWPDAQSKAINVKLEQNTGRVLSVTVTNGGSGYTSAPTVSFTHSPGCVGGACVTATAAVSGGQVVSVTVVNKGAGYCLAPTVSFSGGGGTGAQATANISPVTLEKQEDILIYKNYIKNIHAGFDVVGHTISGAKNCGGVATRVSIIENVMEIDAATWNAEPNAASGSWNATAYTLSGTHNIKVNHNTTINANPPQSGTCGSVFGDGMILLVGDAPAVKFDGFSFTNNIVDFRGCGVAGGGSNGNNANNSLNAVYNSPIFTNNGIMRTAGAQANFPSGNFFVTSWSPQLINFNNGLSGNYRIASASVWKNAATDGRDLGADIDGVEIATENTPTGDWASSVRKCNWNTNPVCSQ